MSAAAIDSSPTVGRYVLYGEIASGGMATVHFGRLQGAAGFARSVAIKRLHRQFAKDPDFVAMFIDEARLAARIAHPNVVPTLDIVSQEDELLLVMEYVRGSSLSRLLRVLTQRGQHVPPPIAASIVSGMLRGLHAAHEAKNEAGRRLDIVHRDVSPQNVLVGTDGIARVLDFGVAKAAGQWQSTRQGQLKGKIAYMAPEQITTGKVTHRTDVYASSVVLWETLTGSRLFRADNEAKLLSMVLAGDVEPPSVVAGWVPKGFDRVVLRGMQRDPSRRFATAREMAAEVEAIVGTAAPSEVGEWVEHVAADELRERANRIEQIERSVPFVPSRSVARARVAPAVANDVSEGASQVLRLFVKSPGPARSRGKMRLFGVAAAAIAVCAIGATALALRGAHPTTDAVTAAIPTAQPTDPPGPATKTATGTWTAIPTTTWTAIPTATSTSAPPPALPRPSPRISRPLPPPKPANNVAPGPECTPPYTEDGKGRIHFKPACVN